MPEIEIGLIPRRRPLGVFLRERTLVLRQDDEDGTDTIELHAESIDETIVLLVKAKEALKRNTPPSGGATAVVKK
jgi:uncharacterized protein YbbK (DUF523 family)